MTIMNEMQINDGNAPRYSAADIANNMVDTDWQDEVSTTMLQFNNTS